MVQRAKDACTPAYAIRVDCSVGNTHPIPNLARRLRKMLVQDALAGELIATVATATSLIDGYIASLSALHTTGAFPIPPTRRSASGEQDVVQVSGPHITFQRARGRQERCGRAACLRSCLVAASCRARVGGSHACATLVVAWPGALVPALTPPAGCTLGYAHTSAT